MAQPERLSNRRLTELQSAGRPPFGHGVAIAANLSDPRGRPLRSRSAKHDRSPSRAIARAPAARLRHTATKFRRDAGESIEEVSSFLDHSSLAVTTTYLRRLEGQEDRTWRDVAVAIGV